MTCESLQRSVAKLEEENRNMRREVEEGSRRNGSQGGGPSAWGTSGNPTWEQAVQTSTMTLLQVGGQCLRWKERPGHSPEMKWGCHLLLASESCKSLSSGSKS